MDDDDMMLQLARAAVAKATDAGAQGAWASANGSREVEFTGRDGELEKVQESTSRKLNLSLYVDGRYSTHSTTSLREDRFDSFISEAVALTRALEPDENRELPDPALFDGRSEDDLELTDAKVDSLSKNERRTWLDVLDEAARTDARVISATGYVGGTMSEGASASSNGFSGSWNGTQLWVGAEVTVADGEDKKPEGGYWVGVRHLDDLPDLEGVSREALRRATSRIGSAKGPSQKTAMIVDPTAGGRLLGRLLGAANARSIYQGRSFWKDTLGQKLLPELLTITDEPLQKRGLGSRYYDGEGIAAKKRTIINAGVVETLFVDTYYGRKAGMEVTTGGRSNLIVQPGVDKGLEELCAEVGEGVYVTSWLGGNADGTTGDFSFGLRGHEVKGGVIGAPIGEMNVTGNLLELFASLVMVGNDPWPYRSTQVPTLVFEGVDFSGA
ncbi:MAG: TldD/PmbA family protein [Deltaproteobacteria bacterium]|nr:TldD/PmbA family protein [Deltaproteobacteria bacterium]